METSAIASVAKANIIIIEMYTGLSSFFFSCACRLLKVKRKRGQIYFPV